MSAEVLGLNDFNKKALNLFDERKQEKDFLGAFWAETASVRNIAATNNISLFIPLRTYRFISD